MLWRMESQEGARKFWGERIRRLKGDDISEKKKKKIEGRR